MGKCRSNLKLQISVLEPGNNNIVFGRTKEIVLRIQLINTNQPAYATAVVVQISNYTTYLGAQVNEGSRGVTCALAENSTLTGKMVSFQFSPVLCFVCPNHLASLPCSLLLFVNFQSFLSFLKL